MENVVLGMGLGCFTGLVGFVTARCCSSPLTAYNTAHNWHLAKSCVQSCKDRIWGSDGEATRILEAQGVLFRREWNLRFRTVEPTMDGVCFNVLMESMLGGALIGGLYHELSMLGFAWGSAHVIIDAGRKAYRAVVLSEDREASGPNLT